MKIALSGGERTGYRKTLLEHEVPLIAVNLTQLKVPSTKELDLEVMFNNTDLVLYTSDGDEDVNRYDEFIRTYGQHFDYIIGRPDYDGSWLGPMYVPLWNDPQDLERLAHLCERYGRVAIADKAITTATIPRIKQLHQRWGATLVGMTSKVDKLTALPFDMAIVSSWTSVERFGETQVWDGYSLRRYPADKKDSARSRHRADITRLGCDFEAVQMGVKSELASLAVKSWMAWHNGAYSLPETSSEEGADGAEMGQVATTSPDVTHATLPDRTHPAIDIPRAETRHESERMLLPVIGIETVSVTPTITGPDGEEIVADEDESVTVLRSSSTNLRQCNSCYLATRCPAFRDNAECAYRIPVELRTKEQLRAVLSAMLEMQTSRVLFAKFAEEMEGQGMDPALSQEIDRLFKLTKDFKDIEDTRDLFRLEVEARGGSAGGVLSQIFGSQAAEKKHQLSEPLESKELDQIIFDADVLDD